MPSQKALTPSAIRAGARALFAHHLPTLDSIAGDPDVRASTRIDAIRALGDFGMGRANEASVHVHAEGQVTVGIITLPALGSGRDPLEAAAEQAQPAHVLASPETPDVS